ncbi:glycosyltransferase family 2 protein [Flavobacterium sp.]|jgi:glycosyltransferase involved in cell wall biosynthesis|uniref:glycosyltransferase family 2 protein n=1 Tax=Flavobacterium sp. TaxID=239 RepID=UPI0037BFEF5F
MIVSVIVITFGHENYIRRAIEGVLMQKCYFDVELIIADDCSPDSTDDIVNEIVSSNENKSWIKYTRHLTNKGPVGNFIWSLKQAKGKYVAICEGDDYWTDPLKLQKQVDFLESNVDFTMTFHSVEVKNEIEGINYQYPMPKKEVLTFKNILFKHFIPTCSLVFIKDALPNPLPSWFNNCKMGDIPLELMLADKGKVKFFNQKMGVYRKNDKSLTQSKEHIEQGRKAYEFLYKSLRSHFGCKYFLLFSILLIKNRLGYFKDMLGLNSSLK